MKAIKLACVFLVMGTLLTCNRAEKTPTGLAIGVGASQDDLAIATDLGDFSANPLAAELKTSAVYKGDDGRLNIYGSFSVEDFGGQQSNLGNTHESAAGWRAYLAGFYEPNFVYQDGGVGVWAYEERYYDLWPNNGIDYGLDAVLAVWHSGHGGMLDNGVFVASMGSDWGKAWNTYSNQMLLGSDEKMNGNERLRYLYWDTCYGIRFSGAHDPMRSWADPAAGLRMMFGYDTTSVDSPYYGQYFWEEWGKGKTFRLAFLDASWRVNHGQTPVVLAFGADQNDAVNRRDNERQYWGGAVPSSYGAWSWYNASKTKSKSSDLVVPDRVLSYHVSSMGNDDGDVETIAQRIGMHIADRNTIKARPYGVKVVQAKGLQLIVEPDGDFELILNAPGQQEVTKQDRDLQVEARSVIDQFSLNEGYDFEVGTIRYLTDQESDGQQKSGPQIVEKTVIFDQIVDGTPIIDPDGGHIEISYAADGSVTRLKSSVRFVERSKQADPMAAISLPEARRLAVEPSVTLAVPDQENPDEGLLDEIVAGSEQVGYRMLDGELKLVYRALIYNPDFPDNRTREVLIPLGQER